MRWVQLTLVENDPGTFDPQFWLDYFRRLHADAATLSAGGIVAYYPTDVPLHHRSAWLGERGSVRSAGRRVAARWGCASSRGPIRMQRERMCVRRIPTGSPARADGELRRHWANPDLWVTCALGPYNFDFMDQVHREIVEQVQGRWHLLESLGAARRRLLLRQLPEELQGCDRAWTCRARPIAAIPHGGLCRMAQDEAYRTLEEMGRHGARGESRGELHSEWPPGSENRG